MPELTLQTASGNGRPNRGTDETCKQVVVAHAALQPIFDGDLLAGLLSVPDQLFDLRAHLRVLLSSVLIGLLAAAFNVGLFGASESLRCIVTLAIDGLP